MQVKEYMTKGAITAHERDGLHQTYVRMHERDVRHMPVIDEHEKLIGVISDRDIRRPDWVDPTENMARPFILDNNTKVSEAMTHGALTVCQEDSIAVAVEAFVDHRIGALMVTDTTGDIVGVLSVVDAMKAFRGRLGGVALSRTLKRALLRHAHGLDRLRPSIEDPDKISCQPQRETPRRFRDGAFLDSGWTGTECFPQPYRLIFEV